MKLTCDVNPGPIVGLFVCLGRAHQNPPSLGSLLVLTVLVICVFTVGGVHALPDLGGVWREARPAAAPALLPAERHLPRLALPLLQSLSHRVSARRLDYVGVVPDDL